MKHKCKQRLFFCILLYSRCWVRSGVVTSSAPINGFLFTRIITTILRPCWLLSRSTNSSRQISLGGSEKPGERFSKNKKPIITRIKASQGKAPPLWYILAFSLAVLGLMGPCLTDNYIIHLQYNLLQPIQGLEEGEMEWDGEGERVQHSGQILE